MVKNKQQSLTPARETRDEECVITEASQFHLEVNHAVEVKADFTACETASQTDRVDHMETKVSQACGVRDKEPQNDADDSDTQDEDPEASPLNSLHVANSSQCTYCRKRASYRNPILL